MGVFDWLKKQAPRREQTRVVQVRGVLDWLVKQPAEPPSNPALVEAMRAAVSSETPETHRAFCEALLSSTLLVPAPNEAVAQIGQSIGRLEEIVTPTGSSLKVPLLPLQDGRGVDVWAAFTDAETMERGLARLDWRPPQRVCIPARDLLWLVWASEHHRIVINSGTEPNCSLTGDVIKTLAEGRIPGTSRGDLPLEPVAQANRFAAREPMQAPSDEIVAALRDGLECYRTVQAAYLCELSIDDGPYHLALGVRFSVALKDEEQRGIFKNLLTRVEFYIDPDPGISMFAMADSTLLKAEQVAAPRSQEWIAQRRRQYDLSDAVQAAVSPFYVRA